MGRLRDAIEELVEERTGKPLVKFIVDARAEGLTLRDIAQEVSAISGVHVSHESIRTWLLEG